MSDRLTDFKAAFIQGTFGLFSILVFLTALAVVVGSIPWMFVTYGAIGGWLWIIFMIWVVAVGGTYAANRTERENREARRR